MVGSRSITLVGIYTGHELGCGILWQLLHDMYCLVVLTLRVDDVNGLCLVADDTTVTNLSTHLTIEWGIVEYELIELILLLLTFNGTPGAPKTITVQSDYDFTVSTSADWLSFDVAEGLAGESVEIQVTCAQSELPEKRRSEERFSRETDLV